jgi:hypothetical protein
MTCSVEEREIPSAGIWSFIPVPAGGFGSANCGHHIRHRTSPSGLVWFELRHGYTDRTELGVFQKGGSTLILMKNVCHQHFEKQSSLDLLQLRLVGAVDVQCDCSCIVDEARNSRWNVLSAKIVVLKFRGASCLGARTHQIRTSTQILDSRYSSYSLLILLLFAIRCLLFSSICSLLSGFRSPSAVRFFAFRFFALRFSLFAFRFFAFRFSLFISCWGNSQRCTSRNCRFRRRFRYIHDVLTGGDLRVRPRLRAC